MGYVDQTPGTNTKAFFNACDPQAQVCSAVNNPEEVSGAGRNGSLVYMFQFTSPTSAVNPAAVPYYRDDACFDDGTGDSPAPRPYPGNASTDQAVRDGYLAYWRTKTGNPNLQASDLKCQPQADVSKDGTPSTTPYQGAIGEHGIHFFMTGDTDNGAQGIATTELDGVQWRFSVPTAAPTNVVAPYAANLLTPLQVAVVPYGHALAPVLSDAPLAVLLPLLGAGALAARRRLHAGPSTPAPDRLF